MYRMYVSYVCSLFSCFLLVIIYYLFLCILFWSLLPATQSLLRSHPVPYSFYPAPAALPRFHIITFVIHFLRPSKRTIFLFNNWHPICPSPAPLARSFLCAPQIKLSLLLSGSSIPRSLFCLWGGGNLFLLPICGTSLRPTIPFPLHLPTNIESITVS